MLVTITLGALLAPAQVSSQSAQNLVQPEVIKIPLKGAGIFGRDLAMVTHLYKPQSEGLFPVGGKLWSAHVDAFVKELGV